MYVQMHYGASISITLSHTLQLLAHNKGGLVWTSEFFFFFHLRTSQKYVEQESGQSFCLPFYFSLKGVNI